MSTEHGTTRERARQKSVPVWVQASGRERGCGILLHLRLVQVRDFRALTARGSAETPAACPRRRERNRIRPP